MPIINNFSFFLRRTAVSVANLFLSSKAFLTASHPHTYLYVDTLLYSNGAKLANSISIPMRNQ